MDTRTDEAREIAERTLDRLASDGARFIEALDREECADAVHRELRGLAREAAADITDVRIRLRGPDQVTVACTRAGGDGRFEVVAIEVEAGGAWAAVGPDEA